MSCDHNTIFRNFLMGRFRGKYAERYKEGTNLVQLDPEVAEAFPTPESVNEALRLVMQLARNPSANQPAIGG